MRVGEREGVRDEETKGQRGGRGERVELGRATGVRKQWRHSYECDTCFLGGFFARFSRLGVSRDGAKQLN